MVEPHSSAPSSPKRHKRHLLGGGLTSEDSKRIDAANSVLTLSRTAKDADKDVETALTDMATLIEQILRRREQ